MMRKKIFFTLTFIFVICVWAQAALYVNEVNSSGKWIEIYNDGATEVNVGGYTVTRNNNDYTDNTATLPDGTIIAANGFIVLFQIGSGAPVTGAIACLPFGISTEKFWSAWLQDKQGNMVDNSFDVGFPQMVKVTEGKSWARASDGSQAIVALDPTPGRTNTSGELEPSELKVFINEVNSTGKWIEIYNDEDQAIDLEGFTLARYNNDNAIAQIALPAGAIIAAKGFLVLYQGEAVLSPVEGAIDCMTFGISSDKFWYFVLRDTNSRLVDNTFNVGFPQTVTVFGGKSWARESDGSATIVTFEPTPGKSNTSEIEISELKIFINEVNATGKWIEIYNDEDEAVDLGGYTVTRNNNDGGFGLAYIPAGTVIAAKGLLVLYQGGVAELPIDGAIDCLPFGISANRFMNVLLKDDQGRIVDNTFDIGNPQTVIVFNGDSWARKINGDATIMALNPTPGEDNDWITAVDFIKKDDIRAYIYAGTLYVPENTSHIQLYTMSGKLMMSRYMNGTSLTLTTLPKGVYIVRMIVGGQAHACTIKN